MKPMLEGTCEENVSLNGNLDTIKQIDKFGKP